MRTSNVLVAIDCIYYIQYITRRTGSLSESSRTNTDEDQHNQSPVSDILFLSEITMFTQAVIQVEIKSPAEEREQVAGSVLMNISSISVCPAVWCRCLLSSDKQPPLHPAVIIKKKCSPFSSFHLSQLRTIRRLIWTFPFIFLSH